MGVEEHKEVEVPIQINPALLKLVPELMIRARIQHLVGLFKYDYERFFATQIDDESTLLYLFHMSRALEILKDCKGFDAHLSEFRNDVESSYLVTALASYLRPKTLDLELEPETTSTLKRADIRVALGDGELFFECKNPRKEILAQLRTEQEPMYEALKDRISRPCDVMITYQVALTESELAQLGQFLEARLTLVTGEGTILDRDGVKIEVTSVREPFHDMGEVQVQMLLTNYHANERNPVNIINRKGVAIAFVKRGVSVFGNIEMQVRRSRNKVPREARLVLAIQSNYLTGPLSENIRAISSLFQPTKTQV